MRRMPKAAALALAAVALQVPATASPEPATGPRSATTAELAPFKEFPVPTPSAQPYGIAVGADGAIWFAESTGNKIGRLNPTGTFDEFPLAISNSAPHELTLGRDGFLYVTLYNADVIAQIKPSGRIRYFPVPSGFAQPAGIATAPDGTIWFAESSENNQIGVLTPDPGFIEEIPLGGVLLRPQGVAAGPDGAMWFTGEGADVIGRITVDTHEITTYPLSPGTLPWAITAGPDGAMWFTELGGRKIGRISMAGVITEYEVPEGFGGIVDITPGFDGRLYFTQSDASSVGVMTTSGQFGPIVPTGRFSWPTAVAAGPDGSIWFTERFSNVITRATPPREDLGSVISTDVRFIPMTETIPVGGTVRWLFQGPNEHAVTDDSGLFDSGAIPVGGVGSFRYTAAGTFPYTDSLHPSLTGTVEVTPSIGPVSRGQIPVAWSTSSSGRSFDVQVQVPGSKAWFWWRRGVAATDGTFPALAGPGTYRFRARVSERFRGSVVGWSPAATGLVSPAEAGTPTDGLALLRSQGYLVPDPATYRSLKARATLRAGLGPSLGTGGRTAAASGSSELGPGPAAPPIIGTSVPGLEDNDITPPDPTGSMGPFSYVEMINLSIGIYDRSGQVIAEAQIEDLVGGNRFHYSDPQVLWDPHTRRFYYLIWDTTSATFRWGFSKDADPRTLDDASWCNYISGFGYQAFDIPDYPKLGQTTDFLLIGVNHFTYTIEYRGGDLLWIKKPQGSGVITTCPRDPATGRFSGLTDEFGVYANAPNPAQQVDPSPVGYAVSIPFTLDGNGSSITVFAVTKNPQTGKPVLGPPHSITVPAYSYPAYAPECGNFGYLLNTLDGRLEHSISAVDPRTGQVEIWTAHAVGGGAGSEVRWYEITPRPFDNPTIFQSGVASHPTLLAFNGAISSDRTVRPGGKAHGASMVMGFSTSSANDCPAVQMVSKVGGNPQSGFVEVAAPDLMLLDFSCVPICRWGDYGGATPDPGAPLGGPKGRVWLANEIPVRGSRPEGTGSAGTWIWEATP